MKSRLSLAERVKRFGKGLLQEKSSPARLAWAVGIGVFIGLTPLYGFHLWMCIVAATVLGLNRVVTYLAANITNPLLFPLLAFMGVQVGTLLMTGEWLSVDFAALKELDLWQFGEAWLLGSLVLGVVLGVLGGGVTYVGVRIHRRKYPQPPDTVGEAMGRVAQRYQAEGRFAAGFVRGKLRHDPVCRQIGELSPLPEPVTDFGCGRGQVALLISELQPESSIVGIDWDAEKVDSATRAAAGSSVVSFEINDITEASIPSSGCILMIDVLHYNPVEVQNDLLERAARALEPGGVLIVRDLDADGGWRVRSTVWQERLARWLRLHRGETLCFRSARSIVEHLEGLGLQVAVDPSSEGLPLANVLIQARKPDVEAEKPAA